MHSYDSFSQGFCEQSGSAGISNIPSSGSGPGPGLWTTNGPRAPSQGAGTVK